MIAFDRAMGLWYSGSVQIGRTQDFLLQPMDTKPIAFVSNALRSWVKTLLTDLDNPSATRAQGFVYKPKG